MRAYLAGPDVFLPDAGAVLGEKVAICARHGIEGVSPLGEGVTGWQAIYDHCVATMESCDAVIANLTPFRGPSADAGTLVELGWFLGRGLPVFAYSNATADFSTRSRAFVAAMPDPVAGIAIEGFGLADNLMIPGAVGGTGHPIVLPAPGETPGFADLATFERCVALAASRMRAG